jgi:hypothetical protein
MLRSIIRERVWLESCAYIEVTPGNSNRNPGFKVGVVLFKKNSDDVSVTHLNVLAPEPKSRPGVVITREIATVNSERAETTLYLPVQSNQYN